MSQYSTLGVPKPFYLISRIVSLESKGPPVLQWTADGTGGLQKIAHNASFIISQHWKLLAAPVQSIYCPKSLATVKKVPFHLEIQGIATFGRNWTNC